MRARPCGMSPINIAKAEAGNTLLSPPLSLFTLRVPSQLFTLLSRAIVKWTQQFSKAFWIQTLSSLYFLVHPLSFSFSLSLSERCSLLTYYRLLNNLTPVCNKFTPRKIHIDGRAYTLTYSTVSLHKQAEDRAKCTFHVNKKYRIDFLDHLYRIYRRFFNIAVLLYSTEINL